MALLKQDLAVAMKLELEQMVQRAVSEAFGRLTDKFVAMEAFTFRNILQLVEGHEEIAQQGRDVAQFRSWLDAMIAAPHAWRSSAPPASHDVWTDHYKAMHPRILARVSLDRRGGRSRRAKVPPRF